VVSFNLPFDLSQFAVDYRATRGRYLRSFSFTLWEYFDEDRRNLIFLIEVFFIEVSLIEVSPNDQMK
jgi:hypothetical protein